MDDKVRNMISLEMLHRPTLCKACGGILVYKGIGEYLCEDCGEQELDDYGKVRNYLEQHRGANAAEISEMTGVSHKAIREMIKDNRFEVIDTRGGYIQCEICGVSIKSGRLCPKCETAYNRRVEEEARMRRNENLTAYGTGIRGKSGSKRFTRDK